jgi:hypothetical protein
LHAKKGVGVDATGVCSYTCLSSSSHKKYTLHQ